MNQVALKEFVTSLNILTLSTGAGTSAWGLLEYWNFVNTNAAGIGVLLTLLFGIIAIIFNLYNSSKLNKVDNNEKRLDKHEEQLNKVEDGINIIIKNLHDQRKN